MAVRFGRVLVLACALTSMASTPALAAPGDLDTTFGGDGKVTTNFTVNENYPNPVDSDFANALVIQADGKIVAAGSATSGRFGLARYNADGTRDTTFSGNGKVVTNFTDGFDNANAVAIQADGKIVAAGRAAGGGGRFALARYNADGTLDASFGGDGKVTTNFTPWRDDAHGLIVQPNGKIVAAGAAGDGGDNSTFALARYTPDGTLDPTFGDGGKVTTNFTTGSDFAFAVAKASGKIVAAGGAGGLGGKRFALARYNANGTRDTTFGGDGKIVTNITAGDDWANGVTIQTDGKIVVAGTGGYARFALARYTPDGVLDSAFGDNGTVLTDFTTLQDDIAYGVAIQTDGKIVAAGSAGEGYGDARFAVARYTPGGAPDTTFADNGTLVTDFTSEEDFAKGVAIQADGKIVVAGMANLYGEFALARYLAT